MAKIDLDSLNIEELALLRDRTIEAGGKGRGTARPKLGTKTWGQMSAFADGLSDGLADDPGALT
jgi:hypothetical protein